MEHTSVHICLDPESSTRCPVLQPSGSPKSSCLVWSRKASSVRRCRPSLTDRPISSSPALLNSFITPLITYHVPKAACSLRKLYSTLSPLPVQRQQSEFPLLTCNLSIFLGLVHRIYGIINYRPSKTPAGLLFQTLLSKERRRHKFSQLIYGFGTKQVLVFQDTPRFWLCLHLIFRILPIPYRLFYAIPYGAEQRMTVLGVHP